MMSPFCSRYFDLHFTPCERFTDRARLSLAVAHQFASEQRREHIEPEHVLRGMASIDRGVARTVLDKLGVDLFQLLPDIAALLPSREGAFPITIELSTRLEALLTSARAIAAEWNHNYLGTEHLVLALLREQPSPASAFLLAQGLTEESVSSGIRSLLYDGG